MPLQIRGPGIPPGVKVGDLAINADLAPTIVDAANANPGLMMDGRSLIPVAQQPAIGRGRELLIEEPGLFSSQLRSGPSATYTPSTAPARGSSTTWTRTHLSAGAPHDPAYAVRAARDRLQPASELRRHHAAGPVSRPWPKR